MAQNVWEEYPFVIALSPGSFDAQFFSEPPAYFTSYDFLTVPVREQANAIFDTLSRDINIFNDRVINISFSVGGRLKEFADLARRLFDYTYNFTFPSPGEMLKLLEFNVNNITSLIDSVRNKVMSSVKFLRDLLADILNEKTVNLLDILEPISTGVLKGIVSQPRTWWSQLLNIPESILSSIQRINPTVWERIKDLSSDAWKWLKENAREAIEAVRISAGNAWKWIQDVGTAIKTKVEWIWNEVKGWYDAHLKSIVDRIKPYLEKINAGITLTKNIVTLKEAIQSGKIERVFRSILELMTTTMADLADVFNSSILKSISDFSTTVTKNIHDAVAPIKKLIDSATGQLFRLSKWIPDKLMDDFQTVTTWLDKATQPVVATINILERETRSRLYYIKARERFAKMGNLRPAMLSHSDFNEQLNLWQFVIGRIIAGH